MTIDLTEITLEPQLAARSDRARIPFDTSRSVHMVVVTAALASALFNTSSPVGLSLVDAIYRGLFAGAVVWLTARSRRWTWPIMAGVAAVSTGPLIAQTLAFVVLGVAAASLVASRRRRLHGAVIAAISVPALLAQGADPLVRLSGGLIEDPHGSSAAIMVLAVLPAAVSGWARVSRRRRARVRRTARRIGVVIASITLATASVAALSSPSIRRASVSTRTAIELGTDGDLDAAAAEFASASADWRRANRWLSGPWMLPGRLVPIVGQHVRASQVISGQASALTDSSSTVVDRFDPDLVSTDGTINVAELDALTPMVDALAATTERAQERVTGVRSGWLLPVVQEAMGDALDRLGPAAGQLRAGAEALHVGVDLIGGESPTRIVVMFSTPAEARGAGGFIGSWAEFTASEGRIELTAQYRSNDLNLLLDQHDAELVADDDYRARYERFEIERHIQDVTISPDVPAAAGVAAQLYTQATGDPVDAVVLLDPFVLEALVAFTGPVDTGAGFALTPSNASNELLGGQYVRFASDDEAREFLLDEVAAKMVERLMSEPPDPIAFAQELAPLAEQGRLALWLADDADGGIVARLGLDAGFPRTDGDILSLVHQNAGQNKIDTHLRREVAVETVLDPSSSSVRHEVTVRLHNDAPESGLPDAVIASNDQGLPLGTNRLTLSMYSPLRLVEARRGDERLPIETQPEFGIDVHSAVLALGPGESTVLSFVLAGPVDLTDGYELTVAAQPLSRPDVVTWRVRRDDGRPVDPPHGWVRRGLSAEWDTLLETDETVFFGL